MVSWNYSFSVTARCNILGKTRNCKMNWAEESEKPPSLLTKTENQRLNWRNPANRAKHVHQNRKTAIFKSETEKPNQILAKSAKLKIPTTPLQGITRDYREFQGIAGVLKTIKGIQRITGIYKKYKSHTRVSKDSQVINYNGIQGITEVCKGLQGDSHGFTGERCITGIIMG